MKKLKNYKLTILLLLLFFSCKNSNLDEGNNSNTIVDGSSNSNGTKTTTEEQYMPPPPPNEIEWIDGNTYTYDYTEQIQWKDSSGTRDVTVYMRNKPTNIQCDIVKCEWCGEIMNSQGYTIDEYPNLDVQREKSNIKEGFNSLGSLIKMILNFDSPKKYFDLDNNRIRTEWTVNCDYGGPDGFCSMKCQSEYNRR